MTTTKQQQLCKLINLSKRASKKGREHLVKHSPNWFIQSICRACKCYADGEVGKSKKTAAVKRRLSAHKADINYMKKCKSMKKARQRLIQQGGFLPALLPLLGLIGKAALGGIAAAGAGTIVRKLTKS